MKKTALAILTIVAMASAPLSATINLQFSDFQDGTRQNWGWSGNSTSVEADAGPDGIGDFALFAPPSDGSESGIYRLHLQETEGGVYRGDFATPGVIAVSFDAMNPSSHDDTLNIHAVLFGSDATERWVSLQSAAIPNDGVWRSYTIALATENDFVQAAGSLPFLDTFSEVDWLGLRHQTVANQSGGSDLSGDLNGMYIDNIALVAVPEPSALAALLGLAALFLAARRRRS